METKISKETQSTEIELVENEEVSIRQWLKDLLGINNAPSKVLTLVTILLCFIASVIFLISYAVFKKIDNDARYLISAESEHISYHTSELLPPSIHIKNFQYAKECGNYTEKIYDVGELNVSKDYIFKITRMVDNEVIITIVKAPAVDKNKEKKAGYFEVDYEEMDFENCLAIKVILDDNNPIFEFNAIGSIELGKNITDAQDQYVPLVLSGNITVTDKTIFSHSTYQFVPYEINKSDYIYSVHLPSEDLYQTAIVRASKGELGLTGIVSLQGGELYVQRYRMLPQIIESSFIDRITNDYELAFSLSISIIFIQFIWGFITFLLRIELLNG
jgi:hypothetical protein